MRRTALPVWLAALGALAYVIAEPHAADLAAASFRSDLFAREGFTLVNTSWYGGHHTPGYSILAPPLGAVLGERVLAGLSAIAATAAFTALAGRTAGLLFVPGILASVASGRVPFTLGAACAIAAVLAATRGRTALAGLAAVATALSSPVAAMFLAIAAAACAGTVPRLVNPRRSRRSTSRTSVGTVPHPPNPRSGTVPSQELGRCQAPPQFLALAIGAVVPSAFLVLAFPEGGTFPFVASAFWPAFVAALAVALVAPAGPLRVGATLYALVVLGAFVVDSPVGGNAVRLATLLAAPVAFALLWPRRRIVLAVLALPIAYWVLQPAVRDVVRTQNDPATKASYHRPLVAFLEERQPARVEIPLTQNHGEAEHVARAVPIARGWLRQADIERNALFYAPGPLTPRRYERWLRDNAIGFVALPGGVPLDRSGEQERDLVARRPTFLREVARRGRWRIFRVRDARPLASAPARLVTMRPDGFTLRFARPGTTTVRVRHSPYWAFDRGHGCIGRAPGGWTRIRSRAAGTVEVGTRFALASVLRPRTECADG